MPRSLLSTQDLRVGEIENILRRALNYKNLRRNRRRIQHLCSDQTLIMLFFASSTRTRASFEAAMTLLGGHAQCIESSHTRFADGEQPKDLARVYSRYGEAIAVRPDADSEGLCYGDGQALTHEFARYATVPVISMGDDKFHPCQGLADLMTLREFFPETTSVNYVLLWSYSSFLRDLSSVQEDLLLMSRFGCNITICRPDGFDLDPEVVELATQNCRLSGGSVRTMSDRREALTGAHVVFPRNWRHQSFCSPARLCQADERPLHEQHRNWMLTVSEAALMGKESKIFHVMPVFRDEEASDEVMESVRSTVFEQAENKLYVQMAVLAGLMHGTFDLEE